MVDNGMSTASPEQTKSTSSVEIKIRSIWDALLDPSITKFGARYINDEDECVINMVLQIIHKRFKMVQKRHCKLEQEVQFYCDELEKQKQQNVELHRQLSTKNENQSKPCTNCQKILDELQFERERYKLLEDKMKKCAFLMNTMVNSDGSELSRILESPNAERLDLNSIGGSVLESTPKPKHSSLICSTRTRQLSESILQEAEVIVPGTPDQVESPEELTSLEKTTVFVPETVPFHFNEPSNDPDNGGRRIRPRPPSMPSPILDYLESTPSKSDLSQSKTKPQQGSNAPNEGESNCYSPAIIFTDSRKSSETSSPAVEDSDDDFQSFSRKKGLFERTQHKSSLKCKIKSRNMSLTNKNKNDKTLTEQSSDSPTPVQPTQLAVPTYPDMQMATSDMQPGPSREAGPSFNDEPVFREGKRKRRPKGPEDWPCQECQRLYYASNIDTRKLKPSMNFCPQHRNRMSYYLNTPPGFWNPTIVGSPRKRSTDPDKKGPANDPKS